MLGDMDAALARERELFLSTGRSSGSVRDEILSSWRRCRMWSVPSEEFDPPFDSDVDPDGRLFRAADPVLTRLAETSGGLGLGFVVTDDDARILARWTSEPGILRLLDQVGADQGRVFSEDAIGTNGLGTAIELGHTVRVDGSEHFAQALQHLTCVGVPISDPMRRRIIGVLDITCAADHDNKLIAILAAQAAEQIQHSLFEQQSPRELALLRRFLSARRATSGIVVISERMMLADPRAGRLLAGIGQPLLWEHAGHALTSSNPVREELYLDDGQIIPAMATALREGEQTIGVLMQLENSSALAARARRTRQQPDAAAGRPPWLVGSSTALLSVFRECAEASAECVTVISGEAGAGKLAVAQAVHAAVGRGSLVVHDSAAIEADGIVRWLNELRGALSVGSGTVVVRHVDLVPGSVQLALGALLGTAVKRGWRCLATRIRRAGHADPVLPDAGVVDIQLAPLRERTQDLAELVTHFADGRQVSSEVTQLLSRLPWPGNVRELKWTVTHMAARRTVGLLTLGDVPPSVAGSAPRRPLSRFEQAEINAILTALADTGGKRAEAAELLGISRSTLYRKLRASGIDLENTAFLPGRERGAGSAHLELPRRPGNLTGIPAD